jgi:hypothetical protein
MVRITVLKVANASAPRWFLEHCETLRAMTAGRSARSARLLGGSMAGLNGNRTTLPRSSCPPPLGFHHFLDIAQQMRQSLLPIHRSQFLSLVTGSPVCRQRPGVVGRYEFPKFFVAMLRPDLIYRRLVRVEHHRLCCLSAYRPTGVVGISDRRMADSGARLWRQAPVKARLIVPTSHPPPLTPPPAAAAECRCSPRR